MASDVIVLSTGNAVLADDISRVEASRAEMGYGQVITPRVRIFLRTGEVINLEHAIYDDAVVERDRVILQWRLAGEVSRPQPATETVKGGAGRAVYEDRANGNNA